MVDRDDQEVDPAENDRLVRVVVEAAIVDRRGPEVKIERVEPGRDPALVAIEDTNSVRRKNNNEEKRIRKIEVIAQENRLYKCQRRLRRLELVPRRRVAVAEVSWFGY